MNDARERTIGLSVLDWQRATAGGADIPIRFKVNGVSMRPLIRKDRDFVTIMPLRRAPRVGEIVLFYRPGAGANYVLHRVWKVRGERVRTLGDGCLYPDAWMDAAQIWGVATLIERGERGIDPNRARWRAFGRVWMAMWWGRRWVWRGRRVLGRVMRAVRLG
ncbi:MAG: S24/S26 family peptidase [Christensenellales bacterium]|jgi:signal peptidase I